MSITYIPDAETGKIGPSDASSAKAVEYENPAPVQWQLKTFDSICAFVAFTGLFFYSLRFLSDDAAIIASLVIAAEATYVCRVGLKWLRVYDVDLLAQPMRSTFVSLALITFVGVGILWLVDFSLFDVYTGGILLWVAVNASHILLSRTTVGLWAKPLAAAGCFQRRIAIVGGGEQAAQVIEALESSDDIDVKILGMFDDRTNDRSPPVVKGYRKLGNLKALESAVRDNNIDLIIVAIPMTAHIRLMTLLPRLWNLPVEIRVSGQAVDMKLSPSAHAYLGKLPLLTVFSRPVSWQVSRLKLVFEWILAALLLIALSPLFVLIAAAIWLTSRGPVLEHDALRDFQGRELKLIRFRTANTATGETTEVGRILKALHLANLPSLFNVLGGEMALVGPTPRKHHAEGDVGYYEAVADAYCVRHNLKPGLTGWASIFGLREDNRAPEVIENRVKYDLEYVDRSSLTLDLVILFKTPFAWIRHERPAYTI